MAGVAEEKLSEREKQLMASVLHWRAKAVAGWADEVAGVGVRSGGAQAAAWEARARRAEHELELMRATFSWRFTAPLRWIRGSARRAGSG